VLSGECWWLVAGGVGGVWVLVLLLLAGAGSWVVWCWWLVLVMVVGCWW
jgi:hypothetical protein